MVKVIMMMVEVKKMVTMVKVLLRTNIAMVKVMVTMVNIGNSDSVVGNSYSAGNGDGGDDDSEGITTSIMKMKKLMWSLTQQQLN